MPENDRAYALLAGKILAEFGATIAVPAVTAAWLGKRLDASAGTSPRYVILCLIVAFTATAFYISRRARAYGTAYDALNTASSAKKPTPPTTKT